MMCPAIDAATHAALFGLCDAYPDVCLPMMGLHNVSNALVPLTLGRVFGMTHAALRTTLGE